VSVSSSLMIPEAKRRNSKREYLKRYAVLKQDMSSWVNHWREIAELILPRRIRYLY